MNFRKLIVFAFSCLLLPALLLAQVSSTSLRGTVTDPSGAVVGNAQVSLDNPANAFHASQTTNADGEYIFPQIPPGHYKVTVVASGLDRKSVV